MNPAKLETSPLTKEQLATFRQDLERRRNRTQAELEQVRDVDLPRLSDQGAANDGYGDDAKLSQERSRLVELIKVLEKRVSDYEAALLRIQNKTFGIDRLTGEPIDMERLRAAPTAETNLSNAKK
jgi:RNA polymerase-binding transcription factor DksA